MGNIISQIPQFQGQSQLQVALHQFLTRHRLQDHHDQYTEL